MVLIIILLVKVMNCETKFFTAAVLPTCQNAIQLVLAHEIFQVEILTNLQI
jgi:hypothetical protein